MGTVEDHFRLRGDDLEAGGPVNCLHSPMDVANGDVRAALTQHFQHSHGNRGIGRLMVAA